jgi:hypothetical protein
LDNCCCRPPGVLATAPLPPLPVAMAPRMSSASPALSPLLLPTVPPMSVAQFARTLLPSKTDVPRSTPQAISAAGTPAVQIAGPTVPWPYSAPFRPTAIAIIVVTVDGVHGQHHHPGKYVQAGRQVEQVDPAHACQVHRSTPCNGSSAAAATAIGQQGG